MEGDRLLTFATILGIEEADIEDVFSPAIYAAILNQAFNLPEPQRATAQKLMDADSNTARLLKKTEAYFAVLPPEAPQFDHFAPSDWLFRNPGVLDTDEAEANGTMERAERVISALNKLLA